METGFYRMGNEEYHSSEGASKSKLHTLLTYSPAHAMAPREETPALYDGTAIHCAVFEPERYDNEYVVKPPNMSFATREGKAWRDDNGNKKIITHENHSNFLSMAKAVREHPLAKELIADGEAEISGFWQDPDRPDLTCKLRADWINKKSMVLVDLKSTTDARPHAIVRDAYKYGWTMQAFFYLYGVTQITRIVHNDFFFVVVEKSAPYGVNVFKASEEFINEGGKQVSKALAIYYECMTKNEWPNYSPDLKDLKLPGWVTRDSQNQTVTYES